MSQMRRRKFALVAASGLLLVGGGVGLALVASSVDNSSAEARPTGSTSMGEKRPGALIGAYLGLDVPPSVWAERLRGGDVALSKCMQENGIAASKAPVADRATWTDADELAVSDPGEFATRYSYGVSLAIEQASIANVEDLASESPVPSSPSPTPKEMAIISQCKGAFDQEMAQFTAPAEVHQRYAQLLGEAADTPVYTAAVDDWATCLAAQNVIASDPMSISNLVADEAVSLVGPQRSAELTQNDAFPLNSSQVRALQEFERKLFEKDQRCRTESGLNYAMLSLEEQIVDSLRSEFPGFEGFDR